MGRSVERAYDDFFRLLFFFVADFFFGGTLAPFFLALLKPMAIACFLLLAFPFLPLRWVPFLVLLTAFFTSRPAALPYFAMVRLLKWKKHAWGTTHGPQSQQRLCRLGGESSHLTKN